MTIIIGINLLAFCQASLSLISYATHLLASSRCSIREKVEECLWANLLTFHVKYAIL